MGMLSKINADVTQHKQSFYQAAERVISDEKPPEKISASEISREKISSVEISPAVSPAAAYHSPRFPESVLADRIPCPACTCELAWESIYGDGVLRCGRCDPPPSVELVGWKVARNLVRGGSDESGEAERVVWEQKFINGGKAIGQADGIARAAAAGGQNDPTLPAPFGDGAGDQGAGAAPADGQVVEHSNRGTGTDPDQFVSILTADGRTGYALRGWDNPRSANYNQRLCVVAGVGMEQAELLFDEQDREMREGLGWPICAPRGTLATSSLGEGGE